MAEHANNGGGTAASEEVVHHVLVESGEYAGRRLKFTQHSQDRYTVFGMSSLSTKGISIERRTPHQESVLLYDSSIVHTLRDGEEWIAYCVIAGCYYGVLGIGAEPEEAYAKAFHRFSG